MYSIYSITDGKEICIHDDLVADQSVKVIDPVLDLSDSNAGSLEFKLAPNSIAYGTYETSEKVARGIEDIGDPIDITGDLSSGDLNQNGEEILSDTALRTGYMSRSGASFVSLDIRESSVQYDLDAYAGETAVTQLTPILDADECEIVDADGYTIVQAEVVNESMMADLDLSDVTPPHESITLRPDIEFKPIFFSCSGSSFSQGGIIPQSGRLIKTEDNTKIRILINASVFSEFTTNMNYSGPAEPKFYIRLSTVNTKSILARQADTDSVGESNRGVGTFMSIETARFKRSIASSNGAYWIELGYEDGSDIALTDIRTLSLELELGKEYIVQTDAGLYRKNGELLIFDHTGFIAQEFADISVDLTSSYPMVQDKCNFIRFSYKFKARYLKDGKYTYANVSTPNMTLSMFNHISYSVGSPSKYKVYEYDNHDTFLRCGDYVTGKNMHSFGEATQNYRIVIKTISEQQISSEDITSAIIQPKKQTIDTIVKNIDLVSKMSSTIIVKRDSWATTKVSNGSFLVQHVSDISKEFENGWITTNNQNIYSTYGIRTSSIIPVTLSKKDVITVIASIRNEGITEDSISSTTARRDAGYYVHFFSNDTWLGAAPRTLAKSGDPIDVPYDDVTGIRILVQPMNTSEHLNISELDFVKLHATEGMISLSDVNQHGEDVENEYTTTTDYLELSNTVNSATNIWSAQISAQSRTGIGYVWGVAMYDANKTYLGMQRWIDEYSRFDGLLGGTKYIRIILKYLSPENSPNAIKMELNQVLNLTVTCLRISDIRTQEEIWEGRILSENGDFKNRRVIYCEGELAYLNDTRQPPVVYTNVSFRTYVDKIIAVHNSKASYNRKFVVGTTWEPTKRKDSDEDVETTHTTNFETTLELLNNLVNDYGGHLRVRKHNGVRYIDWLEDFPTTSNQTIRFGKNLLDFTKTYDLSNMCTALYPTGNVIVDAKSSAVGDHVPMTDGKWIRYENTLLYQDADDKRVRMLSNSDLRGYLTVIATVEPSYIDQNGLLHEKSYYFSGRLHGGFVAYWITDAGGNMYNNGLELSGNDRADTGFVDYIDKKITMPVGANKIWMCTFGSAIPLSLKEEISATEGIDEVLTIDEVSTDVDSDGKVWHIKGSPYITNPDLIEKYGWIEHRFDVPNITDKDSLYTSAKAYLQSGQFDELTLEVSAVDLNTLGVDAEYINLLDKVRVISEPHGIDQYFPVTEIKIPMSKPSGQTFTLGTKTEPTLSGQNASTNTELIQKIEKAPTNESVVQTALRNAALAIATATTGSYINYLYDENGHMKELIISENAPSDTSDPTSIQTGSVWRWNNKGLAHSDGGYNDNKFADKANIAITAEGQVIANELMGKFIYGYVIAAGRMVVGRNLPGTVSGVNVLKPAGVDSAITIVDGSGERPYVDLYNGSTHYGWMNASNARTSYGEIKVQDISQEGGGVHKGLNILAPQLLLIDTHDLGVGKGDGTPIRTTLGSNGPDVNLNMENVKTLEIRNGMIIGYTT